MAALAREVSSYHCKIQHRQKQDAQLLIYYLKPRELPSFKIQNEVSIQIPVVQSPKLNPTTLKRPVLNSVPGWFLTMCEVEGWRWEVGAR